MAKVKITGDTKDAQQKVQKLRKEVERLDKEAKKPKKVTVTTGGVTGGVQGRLSKWGHAGATAMGTLAGNIWTQAIQAIITYAPAVGRLLGAGISDGAQQGVVKAGAALRRLFAGIEVYGNPASEALSRADKLDALDDERRSHNSASNAEEFAYSRAFTNVAGVNGQQVVDRLQSYLDMATSGVSSEMDKAWKILSDFGVTFEDIQKGSTWQVMSKMLAAYHAAGLDGQNELEYNMQQIVGKRQMAAIRKIGDGTEMNTQAAQFMAEFARLLPNEAEILKAAGASEITRTIGDIHGMAIPNEGIPYVGIGAQEISDLAEFKAAMLGGNATEALGAAWAESGISEGVEEVKTGFKDLVKMLNPFADFGDEDGVTNVNNGVINVANGIIEGAGEVLRSAPRVLDKVDLPMPEHKGLFHWGEERLPNGQIRYKSFDPVEQTKKMWDNLFTSNTTSSSGKTEATSSDLNTTMKELTREVKLNTHATSAMTVNLQGGSTPVSYFS